MSSFTIRAPCEFTHFVSCPSGRSIMIVRSWYGRAVFNFNEIFPEELPREGNNKISTIGDQYSKGLILNGHRSWTRGHYRARWELTRACSGKVYIELHVSGWVAIAEHILIVYNYY